MIYPDFGVKYIAFTQYFHSGHKAVDIPRAVTIDGIMNKMANENIYFPHEMKLTVNSYAKDYGYYVRGEYKDGKDTWEFSSGHFDSKPNLEVGKTYKRGDFMSKCGKLGSASSGFHNHFVVKKNGVPVNPLDYCYVYPDQVVGSKETAKLKYYTPLPDIKGVERDESKNQLKVLVSGLRVRKEPNGEQVGWAIQNEIYNHFETQKINDLEWYKIADNMWVGNNGNYVELLPASNYKELYEEELAKNQKLELENKDLQSQLDLSNKKLEDIKSIVNS